MLNNISNRQSTRTVRAPHLNRASPEEFKEFLADLEEASNLAIDLSLAHTRLEEMDPDRRKLLCNQISRIKLHKLSLALSDIAKLSDSDFKQFCQATSSVQTIELGRTSLLELAQKKSIVLH